MSKKLRIHGTFILMATLAAALANHASGDDVGRRDLVAVGWIETFEDARADAWEPDLNRTLRHASDYESAIMSTGDREQANALRLTVGDPGKAMAWTRTTEPVWVDPFRYVRVRYTLESPEATLEIRLEDDATGPVTPGATNQENPLAREGVLHIPLPSTGEGVSEELIDLVSGPLPFGSDRIARIGFNLGAGASDASASIYEIAFLSKAPERDAPLPVLELVLTTPEPADDSVSTGWTTLGIAPFSNANLEDVGEALAQRPPETVPPRVIWDSVPFALDREGRIAGTRVMDRENVELTSVPSGTELHFLMAARLTGSDESWRYKPRLKIDTPERFAVQIEYADGTTQRSIPYHVQSQTHALHQGVASYVVPLNSRRAIRAVRFVEGMSYGQIMLLAATVRTDGQRTQPDLIARVPADRFVSTVPPAVKEPRIALEDGLLQLSSAGLVAAVDIARGWDLHDVQIPYLTNGGVVDCTAALLRVSVNDDVIRSWSISSITVGTEFVNQEMIATAKITAQGNDHGGRLAVTADVVLTLFRSGELAIEPELRLNTLTPQRVEVRTPWIDRIALSPSPVDDFYFVPSRSAFLGSAPGEIHADYNGRMPIQFLDVSAAVRGGGLGVVAEDVSLEPKRFDLVHSQLGTQAAVTYVRESMPIGSAWTIPKTILYPHSGDWHKTFGRYLDWTNTWRRPRPPSRSWVTSMVHCRRDYPVGGTGYLYDIPTQNYTGEALLAQSERDVGGAEMIDISGWAMSEEVGRVGDYRCYELGGVEALQRLVKDTHDRGAYVGLYFEGYLIDRRCNLAEFREDWQLIGKNGEPRWWPGEMEFFACPSIPEWRNAYATQAAAVAEETGADAFYVDEFGFCGPDKRCWSESHGHRPGSNPMREEAGFLRTLREALDEVDPAKAIYTEELPVDVVTPWVDAAFSYAMGTKNVTHHPTRLALMRYAFPEVRTIELYVQGIRAVAASPMLAKLCFFHGHAHWLKGRSISWLEHSTRTFLRKAHPLATEFRSAFASPRCQPLVPTYWRDVHANRFESDDLVVYTLYHGGHTTMEGELLAVNAPSGWTWFDAWNDTPASIVNRNGQAIYQGRLDPKGVGCLVARPN